MADLPYQIINPSGQPVMEAPENCRYPPKVEYDLLEAGYVIKLHGKRITKWDARKAVKHK